MQTNEQKLYICFSNVDEIDVNAFRLLGASTKEDDDSKIGYFGSGLKYAISVFLRQNIEFKIFSGTKEIKVGTRKTKMRGEEFSVITINNTPTSLTTKMGKDWLTWFALREVYCNCLDENNPNVTLSDKVEPVAGETRFYLEYNDEIKTVWNIRKKYFSKWRNEPVFVNTSKVTKDGLGRVYETLEREKLLVYRRGILVHEQDVKNHIFDYDFDNIEINESRTISSTWSLKWQLLSFWKQCTDPKCIARLFSLDSRDAFEKSELDWSICIDFSTAWLTAIGDSVIIPSEYTGYFTDDLSGAHIILPFNLCSAIKKQFGNQVVVRGIDASAQLNIAVDPSDKQSIIITKALDFLDKAGLKCEYDIKIGKLEKGVLGTVNGSTVVLAEDVFDKGIKKVVETIFEEYCHLKSGCNDRTRSFQDALIHIVVTLMEEKTGLYL